MDNPKKCNFCMKEYAPRHRLQLYCSKKCKVSSFNKKPMCNACHYNKSITTAGYKGKEYHLCGNCKDFANHLGMPLFLERNGCI